ncbi:Bug family tripartite tricarboxylate transporter substrate binding protein [Paeniroseomonas aquatica]|uniref:Tripartite tricarboxylate transporter substrate-binding protein n=1 Tax=Paeniroseomonas aquatica TaxID=373043 RepID=A0ABT8AEB8_9PROT|nr:tripartite tricarboxylate transporter substrate-binding protein [Paeniroseomonas aquatica]MDN3568159.1 tripartite tricarboxylate transporter substrate-binding protein [Paeniroseomonas aquatica]
MRRLLLAALLSVAASAAEAFPDRPISLVTGYAPGGSTDIAARILADRLGVHLGRDARVVVENRPGAAGIIASEWLKRQAPDGHTIMLVESSSHAIAPAALVGGTRYNPVEDFSHLGIIGTAPLILVVNKDFPATTAPEVLDRLRSAPPETYTYATSGVGAVVHLAPEMLALDLKTRFVHVPYRSGGQMLTAIFQGEGQFGIAVLASAAQQVRDGMVRGIAVSGNRRFPSFPELPTLAEAGVPGYDLVTWNLILGPPNMPAAVQEALNKALVAALAEPALRQRLLTAGVEAWAEPNGPAEARAFLTREVAKFRTVVERTGVKLEP